MTHIRNIQPQEIPVLDDFLYEAIFIPQGVVPHHVPSSSRRICSFMCVVSGSLLTTIAWWRSVTARSSAPCGCG